jgi:probable rRNA maturation factor
MPAGVKVSLSFGTQNERDLNFTKSELQFIFRFLEKALKKERRFLETAAFFGSFPNEVHLHFCDDAEMRILQKRFRGLDRTTDILSFPSRELNIPTVKLQKIHLGDLVVSLEAVGRGAKRGKRCTRAELGEVLIHGFLHLIGHDHVKSRSKAREMFSLQQELYRALSRVIKLNYEPKSKLRPSSSKPSRNPR